ncbi:chromosome condensation protein CrcB [Pseudoroseomonas rhizosphaerae]|uniref:Fluoride-specific ion channel FluC n=1 Tax=Teichococcus rhizosphaerae TaxID=1335062 RepID=A0A2C7AJP3_9PROT|nr:CrcB family protein [Pseudoroseomonas rhizosphaerae]PHK96997.1 chromosome condensation protein CrcB [Pseudoroseomonas rhizosphaerae]
MSGPFSPGLLALVAAGGAAGSVLRYAVGIWCAGWLGTHLPWGTLAVNVAGSAAIGLLGGAMLGGMPFGQEARLLVVTGFLGGFTTFSAFSLDAGTLFLRNPALAALYLGLTLLGGLGAFAAAFALGHALGRPPG